MSGHAFLRAGTGQGPWALGGRRCGGAQRHERCWSVACANRRAWHRGLERLGLAAIEQASRHWRTTWLYCQRHKQAERSGIASQDASG